MAADVLLVVSTNLDNTPVAPGSAPRKDYAVLQERLDADVLDRTAVQRSCFARALARVAGMPAAQAWLAFRASRRYGAVITDGEHIGIPLALLLKLARRRVTHVTIGHRVTAAKKRPFFRYLRIHTHIDQIALHSTNQYQLARSAVGIPEDHLSLVPYQVDTKFWQPHLDLREERLICSAGLEFRDYPTLARAVGGLDVRVVIGAASHWSKRRNTAEGATLSDNIEVSRFDYRALRDLYARAMLVVVPLDDTDFQAGVTTILEAMAMAKPVVVTQSWGQTDVVQDRRSATRGLNPRPRAESFLRAFASGEASGMLEPTGFYVPPGDPDSLRRAIVYLLDHPEQRRRLGEAGRRTVEQLMTVEQFADRMRALLDKARSKRPLSGVHAQSSVGNSTATA
jgi:glycosyltransferase involved in cell wall biosynthesis